MNKRQKETMQAQLDAEKAEVRKLKTIYNKALSDINDNIARLLGRADTDMEHVIFQVEYQKALKNQISGILDRLNSEQFESISQYLAVCYQDGFLAAMYDIAGQGIPIIAPIDEEQAVMAMKTDSKISTDLYTQLGKDIADMKKRISTKLSAGIAAGYSYAQIARSIEGQSKIGFNRAMRIARTEGHRIQAQAAMNAQKAAKDAGANVVKQWDAALDGSTRPSHRKLDGQIKEIDEPFTIGNKKTMYPGGFGRPEEDINCRCTLLQRAKWALDDEELEELKKKARFHGLSIDDSKGYGNEKVKDFSDFKRKYLKAVKTVEKDQKAIYTYMGSMSYILNEKLRKGMKLTSEERQIVKELDDALDRVSTYQGNLQRSLQFRTNKELESFLSGYEVGDAIEYSQYISATYGNVYNPDGQVQIYIFDSRKGKDISALNKTEKEVLYKRGAVFRVINMGEHDGKHYILLEERNE